MCPIPDYKNLTKQNIVSTPTYFDGQTCIDVLDQNGEPIKLLSEDKDWTMLVEIEPTQDGVLVGCYNDNTGNGLLVGRTNTTTAVA
jgi:hypothetical protein